MNTPKPMNVRGYLAVWSVAGGLMVALAAWDWRPAVIGFVAMLAFAATGPTHRGSPEE